MNKLRIQLRVGVALIACLLGAAFATEAALPSANSQKTLTKKELKSLIENARTAADHMRIAAYYRSKAEHLTAESREHQDLAAAYAKGALFEPKTGIPGGLLAHCRQLAAYEAKAAKEAEDLAAIHEEMAKKIGQRERPEHS